MTTYSDVLTKGMLIEWLEGVPDNAPIALQKRFFNTGLYRRFP
jgi:hypothetical protein